MIPNNPRSKQVKPAARARLFRQPVLRFTPTAFAKLLCLRDAGDTEVGGFGISSPEDLLLIEDVRLVRQECTAVTVRFDDQSVADLFDDQVDQGRKPEEFARVWIHTHPGNSSVPSSTDEKTFARCFGQSDWAIMFILAQEGQTYCRLRFNVGPGGSLEIPVEVDYATAFPAADPEAWYEEYLANVSVTGAPQGLWQSPQPQVDRACLWEREPEFLDVWAEYAGFEDSLFDQGGSDGFNK
jgi:hypothetical protein